MVTDTLVDKWVVVELRGQQYSLPVASVRELLSARGVKLVQVPNAPADVVGVLKLRDETLTVIDLRVRLGMTSMESETQAYITLLEDRRKDHEDWLAELEACVREGRKFRLATDPHACKFGKWYDNLLSDERELHHLTNGDLGMRRIVNEFADPHRRIHAVATEVEALLSREDTKAAHTLINHTRDVTLASMITLFDEAKRMLPELRQPSIVIVEHDERRWGLLVDALVDVESISADSISDPETIVGGATEGFAKRGESESLVSLLSVERILNDRD